MANTEFSKATHHFDPYRNYRFRLSWDGGKHCAGFSKVSALTRTTQTVTHGADRDPTTPRRMPGQSEYQAITLERGVTHDPAFEQWVNKVWDYTNFTKDDQVVGTGTSNQGASLLNFRKDFILEFYNEAGQKVVAYNIYRCWASEYTAIPELDANANAVAIQTLKLENEGWERDCSVVEPIEPSFVLPAK